MTSLIGWGQGIALAGVLVLGVVQPALAQGLPPGDTPEIDWKTIDGERITSADFRDRLTFVEFWATWCPHCMAQMPQVLEAHKQHASDTVKFIGVTHDRDLGTLRRGMKKHNITWPQVFEPNRKQPGTISDEWKVQYIPRMFIFGADGALIWRGRPKDMEGAVAKAVKAHEAREEQIKQINAAASATVQQIPSAPAEAAAAIAAIPEPVASPRTSRSLRQLIQTVEDRAGQDEAFAAAIKGNADAQARLEQIRQDLAASESLIALRHAEAAEAAGNPALAAKLYTLTARQWPETFAGKQAEARAADPQLAAPTAGSPRVGIALVKLARQEQAEGSPGLAQVILEAIVRDYAGTPAATQAEQALSLAD